MRKTTVTYFLAIIGISLAFYLLTTHDTHPVLAQDCGSVTNLDEARAQGLVTSPNLSGGFSTTGGCIVNDNKVIFAPFKIPNYDDLKSLYFDRSRADIHKIDTSPGDKTESYFTAANFNPTKPFSIHHIAGNFNLTSNASGSNLSFPSYKTGVVFIDGNLNFYDNPTPNNPKQFIYGNQNSGIVFVVKGKINIHQNFNQIDAVLISSGKICTALSDTEFTLAGSINPDPTCPSGLISPALPANKSLTINGSLISLSPEASDKISFRRTLTSNNQAAEIINGQPKYLVILKDFFSDTLQKWSEITQ